MTPRDDPIAQAKQMIADARQAFAGDVDGILIELRRFSESLGDTIGEMSREEALRVLRQYVLDKFDQRLPMRNLETALLRTLVREAYSLVNHADGTTVDKDVWSKQAEPFIRS